MRNDFFLPTSAVFRGWFFTWDVKAAVKSRVRKLGPFRQVRLPCAPWSSATRGHQHEGTWALPASWSFMAFGCSWAIWFLNLPLYGLTGHLCTAGVTGDSCLMPTVFFINVLIFLLKRNISLFPYSRPHWLILVCVLTRD